MKISESGILTLSMKSCQIAMNIRMIKDGKRYIFFLNKQQIIASFT